jgi:hypothetical protein
MAKESMFHEGTFRRRDPRPLRWIAMAPLLLGVFVLGFAASFLPDSRDLPWKHRAAPSAGDLPLPAPTDTLRVVAVSGRVDASERDLFGRATRVVILSAGSGGLLFENTVDDEALGEALKEHVGDTVKAEGLVKMKADGKPTLLVRRYEVLAEAPAETN